MRDKNTIAKTFAIRLKELMKADNLNIAALSIATNLPPTTICGWLNLKRTPQIDSLCLLAEFFGVKTDYLLGLEN